MVIMSIKSKQDFTVQVHWNLLDVKKPPTCSGIYAVTNTDKNLWFYIGKANNIAKRITCKNHPIQVTANTNLNLHYLFLRASKEDIGWLERFLIRKYCPEWNGHTSFDPSPMGYTPWVFCNRPELASDCSYEDLLAVVSCMA